MRAAAIRKWGVAAYVAVYVAILYFPVLLLPVFSVNDSATPKLPLTGFTLKWYASLATNSAMHGAAWNSILVGVSSALLSTILGICAARAVTRHSFRGMGVASGLIMAPLILPEIIIAIALLVVLLSIGMQLSLFTVILGHLLICVPYSVTVLISGFEGFDPSMEEASRDLGETTWGTLRRVTLPMLMPSIISSLLVTFTISLDEFILAFFLSGTEPTLPVYIWGQLRFAAKLPNVLALGSILIAASLVMLTMAEIIRRRAEARTQSSGQ
ncbi:MAG: ABC transporter permease [Caldilineaceae bacterium]|nr:ABC transporter permease [Caldilineaceae bacterium]